MPQQQPPSQTKSLILFFLMAMLIWIAWSDLRNRIWPPPEADKDKPAPTAKDDKKGKEKEPPAPAPVVKVPAPPPITPADDLVRLGSTDRGSPFHLGIALDPRGAGVRSVLLNRFQAADPMGRPAWKDAEHKEPMLLELVPEAANRAEPSFLLYHYDTRSSTDEKRPVDTLGRARWKVLGKVEEDTTDDGRKRQKALFQAEAQGVVVTKTYTLIEKDYHLGLEVKARRKTGSGELKFRYQLTGAHGLPVEGKWYTTTFRNALIAWKDRGNIKRDLQDLRQISNWEGGNEVKREQGQSLRYFGVAVQFFASVIAVDDNQKNPDFLESARPTLEKAVAKGTVKSISEDRSTFVLTAPDRTETTFYVQPEDRPERFAQLQAGMFIGLVYHAASYSDPSDKSKTCPQVAIEWTSEPENLHALWEDDITVRASTEPVDLDGDKELVHRYVFYHGPVKVSQLYDGQDVPASVVDRYHDNLHLNTLTDYHSPGPLGRFANFIGFTWLVIKCTNLMHIVLGWLHLFIPSLGLCIILLTVLVRGLMYPVSKKQQLMSFKMQQLAPELKKLQAKHQGDRQAMAAAQMELYRKHGVNPFGTCWFLLLQMPVFMGLYFALQESIRFRLGEFWPTWVTNLAAPDMMVYWGERIPWLSRPEDYGGFFYLGPYFNLLPVIAVALMIVQQKMLTPPPADEQQAFQMKLMRWMMVLFGLFFYKVAAGLCIYFIASSLWGFMERRLLPKFKPAGGAVSADSLLQRMVGGSTAPATAVTPATGRQARPGKRDRIRTKERTTAEDENGNRGLWRRLRDWWHDVLEQARKK